MKEHARTFGDNMSDHCVLFRLPAHRVTSPEKGDFLAIAALANGTFVVPRRQVDDAKVIPGSGRNSLVKEMLVGEMQPELFSTRADSAARSRKFASP
jgi:hypothetical protein